MLSLIIDYPSHWKLWVYEPTEITPYSKVVDHFSKKDAVRELVCLARSLDVWNEGKAEAYKVLDKCRKEFSWDRKHPRIDG
jgi:hypothetical protein